jgi:hypothetical protein
MKSGYSFNYLARMHQGQTWDKFYEEEILVFGKCRVPAATIIEMVN